MPATCTLDESAGDFLSLTPLIELIEPWACFGRAVAIDSTILSACGVVWHQKIREKVGAASHLD